ncbi:MAG TPA: cupredoxin domain-containing protein [Anaerolineae bacterium]|nr:cupredoxin domain-containing protein [Anaerolineae bacterium]
MRKLARILIALAILVSGLASMPAAAAPRERSWRKAFAPAARPDIEEVSIQGFAFVPGSIVVSSGTTVRWTNNDRVQHTVTSDTGLFDSDALQPGETFDRSSAAPGTYRYHCTFHPSMTGTIVVASLQLYLYMPIVHA